MRDTFIPFRSARLWQAAGVVYSALGWGWQQHEWAGGKVKGAPCHVEAGTTAHSQRLSHVPPSGPLEQVPRPARLYEAQLK